MDLASLEHLVVDDRTRGIFRVHRKAFTERAIWELERRRVFERCWLYAAHASELAAPGAFIARTIAGKPILLTRDNDGRLHAFYNTCPHRGAVVCREKAGTRKSFQCGYHGWTFDLKGTLFGQPGKEAYSEAASADGAFDLREVPRLDVFRDFIFVCFDSGAESLENYLDGACEYLDLVHSAGAQGMRIVAGAQEYSCRANWKLLQENSADGYHALATHATYFDYLKARDAKVLEVFVPSQSFGTVIDLGHGHAVSASQGQYSWGRPVARWIPEWGEDGKRHIEAKRRELAARLGEEKGLRVAESDRNLLIFPNLVVNDIMAVTVRTYWPEAPDYMKVNAWALAPKEESGVFLDRRLRNFLEFLGPAGLATPDDVEMLELCQIGYANEAGVEWNDLSRGLLTEREKAGKTEELQMRTFWRRWHDLMIRP